MFVYNSNFYKKFSILKKDGTAREIYQPTKSMKAVQSWILRNILIKVENNFLSNNVMGFRIGKNILDNAKSHFHNRYFLCMDIENFFPSIKFIKVYNLFRTLKYNPSMSYILSKYCTCNDTLPQGGVTSPILSNLILNRLDFRIEKYVSMHNITYTRYADDLIFSASSFKKLSIINKTIPKIVKKENLKMNFSKTRFMGPSRRRKITGLTISDNMIGISNSQKRILRAKIYNYWLKAQGDLQHITGWLSFLKSIDTLRYNYFKTYIRNLCSRNANPNLMSLIL